MTIKLENGSLIIGIGMAIAGLFGIGYGVGVHSKMKKVCDKLDITIDELGEKADIHVSENVVNKAIEEAAERKAAQMVRYAADIAVKHINEDIEKRVYSAVSTERDAIAKDVTEKIAEEVAKIDEDSLRREVVREAKDKIADKFDNKLDGLLDDFNSNLRNVSKIYSSIAQTISGSNSKETIFKVA